MVELGILVLVFLKDLTLVETLDILVWEVWIGNLDILEIRQCKIAIKLDRLNVKARNRGTNKSPSKKIEEGSLLPNNK